jgi:hypothetical protein
MVAQAAMAALFTIVSPILLDDHPGFSPAEKPFHIQTFIAKFPTFHPI